MKKTLIKAIISLGIGIGGLGLAVFAALLIAAPTQAGANPRFISSLANTATATNTVENITPGAGTTTLSHNAFTNSSNTIPGEMALQILVNASTSNANLSTLTIDWEIEYSHNNIDWFGEDEIPSSFVVAQTQIAHSSTTLSHRWTMGTTNNSTTTRMKIVPIIPRLQHTRVVFTMPIFPQGSATTSRAGLWAQLTPIKESSY